MAIINFPSTEVMCVIAEGGLSGIREAWTRLEATLPSLKGRKFYGTFQGPDGPYRACVALFPSDDPQALGLQRWVIPGGAYAQRKLKDWEADPSAIPSGFDELASSNLPDPTRPSVEFYRRQGEVMLLLPVLQTR